MDAPDIAAITKIVKMVGTEFKAMPDEDISFWIGLQAPVISQKKFGADYNLAVALLVCHAMKMAGNGDSSLGTIANTGRLASVSEGGVSMSYSGVVNGEKIVRDVAQEMGCEVKLSPKAKMIDFKNFAFVGTGKTLIGRLCDRSKLRWSVQNGIIQICALDEPLTMAAYVLSADSGMIGSPKPFFESASTSSKSSTSKNASSNTTKRKAKKGIEVTYCLNGHIQIDDYVKVESREDKGNYRASKIRFIGDTEGDDWQCVGQFVEVK